MGIMARHLAGRFVVTSDRTAGDLPSRSAPKRQASDGYLVWTGDQWSTIMADAKTFMTMDIADQYVKATCTKLMA